MSGWSSPTVAWPGAAGPATPGWSLPSGARPGLWRPGDIGIVSFLLGFPAGMALAIDNARSEGRRGQILGMAAIAVVVTVVLLVLGTATLVGAVINIGIAVFLWRVAVANDRPWRQQGYVTNRPGVARAILAIIAGYITFFVLAVVIAMVVYAVRAPRSQPTTGARPSPTAITSAAPSPSPSPKASPTPSPSPVPSAAASASLRPGQTPWPSAPRDLYAVHQDPELEAKLPTAVKPYTFTYTSLRGIVLFRDLLGWPSDELAGFESDTEALGVRLDDVSMALDDVFALNGRASVSAIRIAGTPANQVEDKLGWSAAALLVDTSAGSFTPVKIAGKTLQRGTDTMLAQAPGAHRVPYLYEVGDITFVIIADDPAWVATALAELP